jgi:septal ring factor EnvC (AmiA/AmiB activator)
MTPNQQTALRVMAALEEFTEQQSFSIRVGNCVHAVELQRRAAPLVAKLCELAHDRAVSHLIAPRVDGVLAARARMQAELTSRRRQLTMERKRIAEARRRLQALAPAYGAWFSPAKRLDAAV